MQRARNRDEFLDLIRQALDEVYDLRQSVEYDMEFMADAMGFVDILDHQLQDLQRAVRDGSHQQGAEDLAFMGLVKGQRDEILPFKQLLKRINLTHREGFDEDAA